MPFTPFHLGPGALFKAIGDERFSFMVFGGSQVLMDIEPLVRIVRGDAILHGVSHTVLGAAVIAIFATFIGQPLSNAVLFLSGSADRRISWSVAAASACIGTYSHIGLDAVMHRDMSPLWPLAEGNAWLGTMSVGTLHLVCGGSGLIGLGIIAYRQIFGAGYFPRPDK